MKRSLMFNVALAAAYKLILDVVLLLVILPLQAHVPIYGSFGHANWPKIFLGYVVVILCMLSFSSLSDRFRISRFVISTQYVFILVPFMSIFGCIDLPLWFASTFILGFSTVVLTVRLVKTRVIPLPGVVFRMIAWSVLVLVVVFVFLSLVKGGGFSRFNLDLSNVYETREEYNDSVAPWMFKFVSWTGYVLNMVGVVLALRPTRKRSIIVRGGLLIAVIFLQVLLFGMTSFKAFLFLPFVMVGFVALGSRLDFVRALLIGAPILCVLALLINMAGISMGAALLSRAFFTPAGLHSLYFEYFSSHPFVFFTSNTLSSLFGTTAGGSPVSLVALEYWGRSFSPNVSWIGISFALWGIFGVVVQGALLGCVLRFGDGLSRREVPRGVAEGLLLGPSVALASSALSTTFISAGFFLALFVLWLLGAHYARIRPRNEIEPFS